MDIEERLELIKQVGEEIITEEELKHLLQTKSQPIAYDGFEPSGKMHIAQGILRAININKMIKAGVHFKIWIADWFALMNNKLGGDIKKIELCGKYMIEVWKACGMKVDEVEFLWSKYIMSDEEYWRKVIQIGKSSSIQRIIRCSQIMGRSEHEQLSAAQIFYPCMQCADIFHLNVDICQLGMDQRKVNVLAREIAPKFGWKKPVIVNHHMLMGLNKPEWLIKDKIERSIAMKMSKSIPDNAIFMTDSEEEVERKIKKAYCPSKMLEENPIIEYAKYIIFEKFPAMEVNRPEKFGGTISLESFLELAKLYRAGKIHPMDLKDAVVKYLNEILNPIRKHFNRNNNARELLKQVESFEITR